MWPNVFFLIKIKEKGICESMHSLSHPFDLLFLKCPKKNLDRWIKFVGKHIHFQKKFSF